MSRRSDQSDYGGASLLTAWARALSAAPLPLLSPLLSPESAGGQRLRRVFAEEHRPFWLIVANGILFHLSMALFDSRQVLQAFLTELTGLEWMIGLALAVQTTAMRLPQLYASHKVADGRLRMPYYRLGAHVRWAGIVGVILALLTLRSHGATLAIVFLLCYGVIGFGGGIVSVAFGDILVRTVAPRRRGRLFGLRLSIGGLLGFGAGFLVRWMLGPKAPLAFPLNYAVLLGGSLLFIIAAQLFFMRIREPQPEPSPHRGQSFAGFLSHLAKLLHDDRNTRRYLLFLHLLPAAWTPVSGFLVAFAIKGLGLDAGVAGWFISTGVLAGVVSNLLWARWADRVGNRLVLRLATALAVLAGAGALTTALLVHQHLPVGLALAWLLASNALTEMGLSAMGIAQMNYLYEMAPRNEVASYIGLINTALTPVSAVTGPLLGLLAAGAGYPALFGVGVAAALAALGLSFGLAEPRREAAERAA